MSQFAFTTYAKDLIELRTYVRGIPFEGLEGFLIKMETLDDTIIDFTPPLPKRCVQDYYRQFFYQPVDAQCYVDGCHRPLMSKSYWTEKDKKRNPHSPTFMYSTLWPSEENDKEQKERNDDDDDNNKEVDGGKI